MNQNHIYRKSAFSVGNINCLFLMHDVPEELLLECNAAELSGNH